MIMDDEAREAVRRRWDTQPGLARAAENACIYKMTDGFCHPRNTDVCRCWDAAQSVQRATGMSAQAVAWVFRHPDKIEAFAAKPEERPA